ncbi:hypothetical protein K502DRAFT_237519 [Neoconidiobolus thromboides FSU 785]|nr:hypothetical protein K502DRAFT_237519 [Neoconidiobolus thromboides FSU 785]
MLKLIIKENYEYIINLIIDNISKVKSNYFVIIQEIIRFLVHNDAIYYDYFLDKIIQFINVKLNQSNQFDQIEISFVLFAEISLIDINSNGDEEITKKVFDIIILIGNLGYQYIISKDEKLLRLYCKLINKYVNCKDGNLIAHLNLIMNNRNFFLDMIYRLYLKYPKFYSDLFRQAEVHLLKYKSIQYKKFILNCNDQLVASYYKQKYNKDDNKDESNNELVNKNNLQLLSASIFIIKDNLINKVVNNQILHIKTEQEFTKLYNSYEISIKLNLIPKLKINLDWLYFVNDKMGYLFYVDSHQLLLFYFSNIEPNSNNSNSNNSDDNTIVIVKSNLFINPFLLWNFAFHPCLNE